MQDEPGKYRLVTPFQDVNANTPASGNSYKVSPNFHGINYRTVSKLYVYPSFSA